MAYHSTDYNYEVPAGWSNERNTTPQGTLTAVRTAMPMTNHAKRVMEMLPGNETIKKMYDYVHENIDNTYLNLLDDYGLQNNITMEDREKLERIYMECRNEVEARDLLENLGVSLNALQKILSDPKGREIMNTLVANNVISANELQIIDTIARDMNTGFTALGFLIPLFFDISSIFIMSERSKNSWQNQRMEVLADIFEVIRDNTTKQDMEKHIGNRLINRGLYTKDEVESNKLASNNAVIWETALNSENRKPVENGGISLAGTTVNNSTYLTEPGRVYDANTGIFGAAYNPALSTNNNNNAGVNNNTTTTATQPVAAANYEYRNDGQEYNFVDVQVRGLNPNNPTDAGIPEVAPEFSATGYPIHYDTSNGRPVRYYRTENGTIFEHVGPTYTSEKLEINGFTLSPSGRVCRYITKNGVDYCYDFKIFGPDKRSYDEFIRKHGGVNVFHNHGNPVLNSIVQSQNYTPTTTGGAIPVNAVTMGDSTLNRLPGLSSTDINDIMNYLTSDRRNELSWSNGLRVVINPMGLKYLTDVPPLMSNERPYFIGGRIGQGVVVNELDTNGGNEKMLEIEFNNNGNMIKEYYLVPRVTMEKLGINGNKNADPFYSPGSNVSVTTIIDPNGPTLRQNGNTGIWYDANNNAVPSTGLLPKANVVSTAVNNGWSNYTKYSAQNNQTVNGVNQNFTVGYTENAGGQKGIVVDLPML